MKKYRVRREKWFFNKNKKVFKFVDNACKKYWKTNKEQLKAGSISFQDIQQEVKIRVINWIKIWEKKYAEKGKVNIKVFLSNNIQRYINYLVKKQYGLLKAVNIREEGNLKKIYVETGKLMLNPNPRKITEEDFISKSINKATGDFNKNNESAIQEKYRKEEMERLIRPFCEGEEELNLAMARYWYGGSLREIRDKMAMCRNCGEIFINPKKSFRFTPCTNCGSLKTRKKFVGYSRQRLNLFFKRLEEKMRSEFKNISNFFSF